MELRRIKKEDLTQLFNMRNDPEIYRWCRQHDVLHFQNHLDWYEKQAKDQTMSMYAIEVEDHLYENSVVGICGLTSIDYICRRAEFSLYIGEEYQGRGYGRKALKELLSKGFDDYNLNLIWGETFQENPAAFLFEKIGMKHEGSRRQFYYKDGKYIDANLYSITRDEWNTLQSL